MTFERPFEIHDDIEVLKRLGLAYGLDTGHVADEDVERVKQCLPPALRVYVDQILDQPMEEDHTVNVDQHDDGNLFMVYFVEQYLSFVSILSSHLLNSIFINSRPAPS